MRKIFYLLIVSCFIISSCSFSQKMQNNDFVYKGRLGPNKRHPENITFNSDGTFFSGMLLYSLGNSFTAKSGGSWSTKNGKIILSSDDKYYYGIIENIEEQEDPSINGYSFRFIDSELNVPLFGCGICMDTIFKNNIDTSSYIFFNSNIGYIKNLRNKYFAIYCFGAMQGIPFTYILKNPKANFFIIKVKPWNSRYYYFQKRTFHIIGKNKFFIMEDGCLKVFKKSTQVK